ncbi:MAG: holliday junction helicase RuvA [Kosmotogales bacterium]|nr:holliday junction helicase RuvA [Kosmotogales bacterium]
MLAGIKCKIHEKKEWGILAENNGFFFNIFCSNYTLEKIEEGSEYIIYTHLQTSQDKSPQLYGFFDKKEEKIFKALIKVNKIGPKVALKLLSSSTPDKVIEYIATKDAGSLSTLPGIGAKTAERLIIELSGLYETVETEEMKEESFEDAIEALLALGFDKREITKAVKKIFSRERNLESSEIIRKALNILKK